MSTKMVYMILGGLVSIAILSAVSSEAPQVVVAERFEVRDQEGKLRGTFGVIDNIVVMNLHDKEQRRLIQLHVLNNGTIKLELTDSSGASIAQGINENGLVGQHVLSQNASIRQYAGPDGACFLQMRDQDQKVRVTLTVTPEGWPKLEFKYPSIVQE